MEKKLYVVSFCYEEVPDPAMSEMFGMKPERAADLSLAIVAKMIEASKAADGIGKAGSITAVGMDFFDDLEPDEQGPFMATAMMAYFKKMIVEELMKQQIAESMRRFFEQMGGGVSGPG